MMSELLHYNAQPVSLDRSRVYDQREQRGNKPNGLWLSVSGEDDWECWCRENGFGIGGYVHRATLQADANVLWLRTAADIDQFHLDWSEKSYWTGGTAPLSDEYVRMHWEVNWQNVAQRYDGIMIAPYQWSRRLGGPFWYYGWDCASGCIWQLDAVASFTQVLEGEVIDPYSIHRALERIERDI